MRNAINLNIHVLVKFLKKIKNINLNTWMLIKSVLLIERINPSLTLQRKEIIQSAIFIRIEKMFFHFQNKWLRNKNAFYIV